MRRRLRIGCAVLAGLVLLRGGAATQPVEPDTTRLFGRGDVALAGTLLAAQVALFAFDGDIHRVTARMRSDGTDDAAAIFRPLGRKPPWYYASAAAYAIGQIAGERRVADVGLHAFVSLALANVVSGGLKGLTGRFRPIVLDVRGADSVWVARDPDHWGFLAGWREGGPRQSWPSGHTTAAFTMAAVLSEELGGAVPWVAYPIAAGVAWSRLNDQAHWASDVVMGALVGTFTARLVVRHGHARAGWLERTLLLEEDPYGRGVSLGVRLRSPL